MLNPFASIATTANSPSGEAFSRGSPELESVRQFRSDALANGYSIIRVHTSEKTPVAKAWTKGESAATLLNVTPEAANTGLITAGLRVVDIDVDDPEITAKIVALAQQHLPPGALIRRRGGPRHAMFYRAAEGHPRKRNIGGKGHSVEVLGAGQYVVADGIHTSGAQYWWDGGRSPATVPVDQLPVVIEEDISVFLDACGAVLGVIMRSGGVSSRYMDDPALFPPRSSVNDNIPNAPAEGIERLGWFGGLPAAEKKALVKTCLDMIDNSVFDPRERWLSPSGARRTAPGGPAVPSDGHANHPGRRCRPACRSAPWADPCAGPTRCD